MKKNLFFIIACMAVFTFMSCSSDEEEESEQQNPKDEFVEVNFNFSGDFINVEEKPMRAFGESNLYYYIQLITKDHYENGTAYPIDVIGFVGLFKDLKYARLKVERGTNYVLLATALKEAGYKINLDEISKIKNDECAPGSDPQTNNIDILNNFSDYLIPNRYSFFNGAIKQPEYENEKIERFYNQKDFMVNSNETVSLQLKRFSYMLTLNIDSPIDGKVVLSCDSPSFKYCVNTNDANFTNSTIYSLGGFDLETASKTLTLKLEKFDFNGKSENVSTREIVVKPNFETTVHVNYENFESANPFNITLDDTSMNNNYIDWR